MINRSKYDFIGNMILFSAIILKNYEIIITNPGKMFKCVFYPQIYLVVCTTIQWVDTDSIHRCTQIK